MGTAHSPDARHGELFCRPRAVFDCVAMFCCTPPNPVISEGRNPGRGGTQKWSSGGIGQDMRVGLNAIDRKGISRVTWIRGRDGV